jgi:flagellar protein FlbD
MSPTGHITTSFLSALILFTIAPITLTQEPEFMIHLTRLNGNPMVVNSDLIKFAEASPDTMLTLINGEKLIVREGLSDVVERVLIYRARLLADVGRQLPGLELPAQVSFMTRIGSLAIEGQQCPGSKDPDTIAKHPR